jgi:glutamate carboxypeptidase
MPIMTVAEDRALGQGVVDMKGGIVCALTALQLLHKKGFLDSLDLTVLHESDEEVGNPSSRALITQLAPEADLVLVFEEAGKDQEIVIGRRGIVVIRVECRGVAGHAGNVSGNRRNAIEELAFKIAHLREIAYSLTDKGILFNVGTITGGTVHNVIAERASCEINLRFSEDEGLQLLRDAFDRAVATPTIPGTNTTIDWNFGAGSPAMPVSQQNQVAAKLFIDTCALQGYSVSTQVRGGTSAANLWAQEGVAVIDGLGPIGGDDHSEREWMSIPSLFVRIQQVAFFLQQIARGAASAPLEALRKPADV